MKILASTENGFFLEASKEEIANLLGYYSDYSLPKRDDYRSTDKLRIGDTINVAGMYKHLYALASDSKEIVKHVAKLRAAADLIDTLPNPVTQVSAEPDTKTP